MLLMLSALIILGLSSCLKEYTCNCERTYYRQYRVDSTYKFSASFNGSRKAPVIQDCERLQDSSQNADGTGVVTRCDIKED